LIRYRLHIITGRVEYIASVHSQLIASAISSTESAAFDSMKSPVYTVNPTGKTVVPVIYEEDGAFLSTPAAPAVTLQTVSSLSSAPRALPPYEAQELPQSAKAGLKAPRTVESVETVLIQAVCLASVSAPAAAAGLKLLKSAPPSKIRGGFEPSKALTGPDAVPRAGAFTPPPPDANGRCVGMSAGADFTASPFTLALSTAQAAVLPTPTPSQAPVKDPAKQPLEAVIQVNEDFAVRSRIAEVRAQMHAHDAAVSTSSTTPPLSCGGASLRVLVKLLWAMLAFSLLSIGMSYGICSGFPPGGPATRTLRLAGTPRWVGSSSAQASKHNEGPSAQRRKFTDWGFQEFLSELEQSFPPHRHVFARSHTSFVETSIIDEAERRLDLPLISFDPAGAASLLRAGCDLDGFRTRNKGPYFIVRGQGGGKTRAVEATRAALLNDSTVLPIAITMNHITPLDGIEITEPNIPLHLRAGRAFAFSIVARMLHSFCRQDFDCVTATLEQAWRHLDDFAGGKMIIERTARWMLATTAAAAPHAPVTSLVLLVDEAKVLQDKFSAAFPHAVSDDIYKHLRRALRGRGYGLLISSLTPGVSGVATTGWDVGVVDLPESLDAEQVVRRWWKISSNDTSVHCKFFRLASYLSSLPRALDIAGEIIAQPGFNASAPGAVGRTVEHVFDRIRVQYVTTLNEPDPDVLYRAVYGIRCVLQAAVLRAVENSMLTNSLKRNQLVPGSWLDPHANLMFLCAAASESTDQSMRSIYSDVQSVVSQSLDGCHAKEGDVLEKVFFPIWLRVRLHAAHGVGAELSVAELLGLEDKSNDVFGIRFTAPSDAQLLVANLTASIRPTPKAHNRAMKNAFSDEARAAALDMLLETQASAFSTVLKDCTVGPDQPLQIYRTVEGDLADYVLVAWDRATAAKCTYIVEIKSRCENEGADQERKNEGRWDHRAYPNQFPGAAKQYQLAERVMRGQRWGYIYHTTLPTPEQRLGAEPLVLAGRKQTERFYGPAISLFDALHSMW
jgi:hypothetical protein